MGGIGILFKKEFRLLIAEENMLIFFRLDTITAFSKCARKFTCERIGHKIYI